MSLPQKLLIAVFLMLFTGVGFSQHKKKNTNFGGRIMFDAAVFLMSDDLKQGFSHQHKNTLGYEFRRIFAYASGDLSKNIAYRLQLNFAGAKIGFRDAYIGFKNIPFIGNIRVGQVKEPIRLEVLNSSNYLTFMERSFNVGLLPIRNSGVLFKNDFWKNRLSYQLGVFSHADPSSGNAEQANENLAITGRITTVPIQKPHQFLHLGVASSYRIYADGNFKANIKPEANLSATAYISIKNLTNVQKVNIYNAELAYGYQSFNLQSEYTLASIKNNNSYEQVFTYYLQTSYFLTGEHKKFKNSYTAFRRLVPKHCFNGKYIGALELALRYSYLNANAQKINAGVLENYTFGLNWYITSNAKIMFNQVFANLGDNKHSYISQIRVQVDF